MDWTITIPVLVLGGMLAFIVFERWDTGRRRRRAEREVAARLAAQGVQNSNSRWCIDVTKALQCGACGFSNEVDWERCSNCGAPRVREPGGVRPA